MDRGGTPVHRRDAWPRAVYSCPGCGGDLLVYDGPIRAKHYRHRAEQSCGGEGALHRAARRLVVAVVSRWRRGLGSCPVLVQACPGCHRPVQTPLRCPRWVVPVMERRIEGGHRADVALLDEQRLVLAVEIRVTHAVDAEKYRSLEGLGLPWVELDGEALLREPLRWPVLQGAQTGRACRPECELPALRERLRRAAQRDRFAVLEWISRETRTRLPPPPWEAAPAVCWRCEHPILVFRWPGHAPWSDRPPPNPHPKTIHRSFSRWAGRWYWANTCPYCDHIQSDRALYLLPDGPFFTLSRAG